MDINQNYSLDLLGKDLSLDDENLTYEERRKRIIQNNKAVLAKICAEIPPEFKKQPLKRKAVQSKVPKKRQKISKTDENKENGEEDSTVYIGSARRRRSARIRGQEPTAPNDLEDEAEYSDEEKKQVKQAKAVKRPMVYGAIGGVRIGKIWQTRMECNYDNIHRPTVAGIHGGPSGAYSIALSGNYEDNIDMGHCFTYTGEGGRDLKGTKANPKNLRTAPQTKDQCLSRGNAALVRSVETGLPVRVIRGYKLNSDFAPNEGYRYDGLYTVKKWWTEIGLAGFKVFRFALARVEGQGPAPWEIAEGADEVSGEDSAQEQGIQEAPLDDSAQEQGIEEAPLDDSAQEQGIEEAPLDDSAQEQGTEEAPLDDSAQEQGTEEAPLDDSAQEQGTEEAPIDDSAQEQGTEEAPINDSAQEQGTEEASSADNAQDIIKDAGD